VSHRPAAPDGLQITVVPMATPPVETLAGRVAELERLVADLERTLRALEASVTHEGCCMTIAAPST